jgi:hypothetical protein
MSSKNELKLVYGIAIICLIVSVLCYGPLSAKSPEEPVRLMFKTVGGNVLFDHQTHSDDYDLECMTCHHTYVQGETDNPVSCESCHQADSEFVPAMGDNGNFDHDVHSEDYGISCNDCHHNYYEEDGGEPELCSDCHEPGVSDEYMLGRTEAFHQQCIGCHEDNGVTPGQTDCASCHAPRKQLDAFHDQCINCHEDLGAGPSGSDEDCKQCHGF